MQCCAAVRTTYRKQQTPQLWMVGRSVDSFVLWSYPIWVQCLNNFVTVCVVVVVDVQVGCCGWVVVVLVVLFVGVALYFIHFIGFFSSVLSVIETSTCLYKVGKISDKCYGVSCKLNNRAQRVVSLQRQPKLKLWVIRDSKVKWQPTQKYRVAVFVGVNFYLSLYVFFHCFWV